MTSMNFKTHDYLLTMKVTNSTTSLKNFSIRGRLGSISQFTRNLGVLIAFIVAAIVEYETLPCIFASVPIIFGISFFFLPNTPQFYLQRRQENVRHTSFIVFHDYFYIIFVIVDCKEFTRVFSIINC